MLPRVHSLRVMLVNRVESMHPRVPPTLDVLQADPLALAELIKGNPALRLNRLGGS
jgi:hypothetical protein